ncbi:MAG TPA: DUF2793 domain-containing protein [Hyphomicrobiaceae bacterium]|jgi:hypothetical protein|nr:DUF2793 domain-containing protein [Hyphomicrobiaceae bacterium]
MDTTANLDLPYIMAAQAQKHVTHNEALRALDALVQLAVVDKDLSAPPGSPAEGARYIVATGATGAWAGHDGEIAAYQDGAWMFYAPNEGWTAWVADEDALYAWDGSAWGEAAGSPTGASIWGVSTTADTTNRLAVASDASLFTHAGSGHQHKINKNAAGDTASLLFQTGFSGRAEMGTAGDDNFHVKVSPDGSAWKDAITIDRSTGVASFPFTPRRELLTAARTYYVRADGSDSNDGLTNSAGGAFLTIQKAIDTVGGLDLGIYDATIQIANGTWTENLTLKSLSGAGTVILRGDPTTPANVVLSISAGTAILSATKTEGLWRLDGLKLTTSGGTRHGLLVTAARVDFQNIEFAAHTGDHVRVQDAGGLVTAIGPYKISGGGVSHQYAAAHGMIRTFGISVTLTGTPAFSTAFVRADSLGLFRANGMTFTGSATGTRYTVDSNGVIYTAGGGATYFPGSGAGSTANGGQYV